MGLVKRIAESTPVQIVLTLLVYALYAFILGLSLTPAVYLVLYSFNWLIRPEILSGTLTLRNVLLFSLVLGGAFYIFFFSGVIVMSMAIRLLSLGIKPGKYPAMSITTLRWLIYSGIYTLAIRLILPLIPMTFFTNLFFRIMGCKMGKNVKLNTWNLNDAYLLELGDNVIVGGATDISCHIFENYQLILKPIKIGENTLIGAHCYISPGVIIGKNCTIGLNSFIRQDKVIPDNTKLTSVSSLNMRDAYRIERGKF